MSRKVMQIGYEPERDRLTWDGWDIHCGQYAYISASKCCFPNRAADLYNR